VKRHVALVGFMAAGKSTIGRKLARRLECAFVDTDELIVREHGPIKEIFSREGEAAFRRYEREAIEQVLTSAQPCVAALGGGAMTIPENRTILKSRAHTIFLRVSAERIAQRVRHSPQARPVLGARPSLSRIRALYRERMPQYADADHVIEAERMSDRQIIDAILLWLNERA
jgi:shikimate kinase